MNSIMIPLCFVLGILAGGLLVRYWRARAWSETPVRGQKIKLVLATVFATTLFLAATGYAAFRYTFRPKPVARATTANAVKDYRKAGGGHAANERKDMPAGGVYTYQTKGYMKARSALLGNLDRPMPKSIPAVVIQNEDCWELGLRLFKEHQRTERYCGTGKGIKLVQRWEKNKMFGIKTFARQGVGPHPLLGPTGKTGGTFKTTWKVLEHKSSLPIPMKRPDLHLKNTYVGVTKVEIEGKLIPAHHLRQVTHYKGAMSGTMKREIWYAVHNGMMLKLKIHSQGSGVATLTIDREYLLKSLRPKR
jgi:hypothetical protein